LSGPAVTADAETRFALRLFPGETRKLEYNHSFSKAQIGMFRVNPKLEAFFHTPIPPELWHYTSVGAFEKILSSGKFWATEARFTTDKDEYVFAYKVATEYVKSLKPRLESVGLDESLFL
jgi:hypothetical protein